MGHRSSDKDVIDWAVRNRVGELFIFRPYPVDIAIQMAQKAVLVSAARKLQGLPELKVHIYGKI